MIIFLSLRVTADAEGGLKIRAQLRPDLQGLGGGSHQQASLGIYRGIACHYHSLRFLKVVIGTLNCTDTSFRPLGQMILERIRVISSSKDLILSK